MICVCTFVRCLVRRVGTFTLGWVRECGRSSASSLCAVNILNIEFKITPIVPHHLCTILLVRNTSDHCYASRFGFKLPYVRNITPEWSWFLKIWAWPVTRWLHPQQRKPSCGDSLYQHTLHRYRTAYLCV